jgi:hypothetical protein
MRRVSSIILIIPLAALLVGSARLSSICSSACGAACSSTVEEPVLKHAAGPCMEKESGTCGKTVQKHSCSGRKLCGQGACHKSKDSSKDKGQGSCWVDCPLCTLVTLKPFFRFEINRQVLNVEYAVMREDNLSDYVRPHWKPPAFFLLS